MSSQPIDKSTWKPTHFFNKKFTIDPVGLLESNTSSPQSGNKLGSIVCTEYSLNFRPKTPNEFQDLYIYKNDVRGPTEIILSTITSISILEIGNKNKSKHINCREPVEKIGKRLNIICADFSIHSFMLNISGRDKKKEDEAIRLINHLVAYAFPSNIAGLWSRLNFPTIKYDKKSRRELQKPNNKTNSGLRICEINTTFKISATLPPYFLLPNGFKDEILEDFMNQFEDERGPVVCFVLPQKKEHVFLLRAGQRTHNNPKSNSNIFRKGYEELRNSLVGQDNSEVPKKGIKLRMREVNDGRRLNVRDAWNRLAILCEPESQAEFNRMDKHWSLELAKTGWPTLISEALKFTGEVIHDLIDCQSSNLLQEAGGGRNWTCLYASLVRLCLFRKARTQAGFQKLVEEEWVCMGHDFSVNRGHIHPDSPPDSQHIFALFIDCVYQLTRQFPLEFEFSHHFLIALLDASAMSCYIEFSFSCEKERVDSKSEKGEFKQLLSVWEWEASLSSDYIKLFDNNLYKTALDFNHYKMSKDPLVPLHQPIVIEFWSYAYLRWVEFSVIKLGGAANTEMCYREQYDNLVDAGCRSKPINQHNSSLRHPSKTYSSTGARARAKIDSYFPYAATLTAEMRNRNESIYRAVNTEDYHWSTTMDSLETDIDNDT